MLRAVFLFLINLGLCLAGSKSKRHSHNGILTPFDGRHVSYAISLEENTKLDAGQPVIINERTGKNGRGTVIQDIHASPEVCMGRIRDLANYNKMVPNVKKVTPYNPIKHSNGTEDTGAEFSVGLSLLTFTYYLNLRFEPKYFTLTWTLDYQYDSDFDDNTGHWQVMQHPTKPGWSRILYSCEVKVFNWLPDFVINFLTKTALVESTTWVKRESEKFKGDTNALASYTLGDLSPCFQIKDDKAVYTTDCAGGSSSREEKTKSAEEEL